MNRDDELPGVVLPQYVRCGKTTCRCHSRRREDLHGPYFYRFFRENGRLRKTYVPKDRVEQVRAACKRYREEQRARRRVTHLFQQDD